LNRRLELAIRDYRKAEDRIRTQLRHKKRFGQECGCWDKNGPEEVVDLLAEFDGTVTNRFCCGCGGWVTP